ncbi:MAG: hypothetical protein P1P88_18040 [Bacteroidales bacterium]|nr:hypothetical protein [Bacteroidales bacterium]
MKKIAIFLILFSLGFTIKGQDAVATNDEIQKFMKTKTYVVYDENIFGSYNKAIKKAVEDYWTLTPVEFIDAKEYAKLKGSYRNSFIIRTKVNFDKDKSNTSYTFLSILLGSNKGSMESMPDLCSFPLSYYNVDYDKYHYKMGAILKFMQNHIILTRDNPNLNSKNILRYYNNNTLDLKGKTLYVIEDELDKDVNTEAEIKNFYPGKVIITTSEEIEKVIHAKDPDAVFLHKVGPSKNDDKLRIYKLILGASDGKLYYFGYHKYKKGKAEDAFLSSDFKKLGS